MTLKLTAQDKQKATREKDDGEELRQKKKLPRKSLTRDLSCVPPSVYESAFIDGHCQSGIPRALAGVAALHVSPSKEVLFSKAKVSGVLSGPLGTAGGLWVLPYWALEVTPTETQNNWCHASGIHSVLSSSMISGSLLPQGTSWPTPSCMPGHLGRVKPSPACQDGI